MRIEKAKRAEWNRMRIEKAKRAEWNRMRIEKAKRAKWNRMRIEKAKRAEWNDSLKCLVHNSYCIFCKGIYGKRRSLIIDLSSSLKTRKQTSRI